MAHGRKRSFVVGLIVGGVLSSIVAVAGAVFAGLTLLPSGQTLFPASAKASTLEWARLSPLPNDAQSFTITTNGGLFSREFQASFFGEPSIIASWVQSCPGIKDPKCVKTIEPDGKIIYKISAGGGAMFAELIHYPARGTVSIRTFWS